MTGRRSPHCQGEHDVATKKPLFNRPDTLLGVCEGLGTDLGFHPNILRIAFGVGLMWNPLAVIGTYLALGLAVYGARFLFPDLVPETRAIAMADGENDEAATPDRLAA
jgi:phage shock protein PspC (stress-responsive transcriptional regulator)